MNKLSLLLLALVALVVELAHGYYVTAPQRTRGPWSTGYGRDYGYGSPYVNGGSSYYHYSDLDWGNFSPNPAFRTNGYNYFYNGGTGYYADRYYTKPYYAEYGGYSYDDNYYYRPSSYYRYGYDNYYRPSSYYRNGYDDYDRRRYYSNMDWGSFSPYRGRRNRYYYNNYY